MAPENWPDWLPTGWTMQVRKVGERAVKCYLDPAGNKFYSKPQVFRHLEATNNSTATEKNHNADGSTGNISAEPSVPQNNEVPESSPTGHITKRTPRSCNDKSKETVGLTGEGPSSEPNASPQDGGSEWLPDGWTMEVLTREHGSRIGMRYKCYIESASGRKFFSKPQVLNYLANTNGSVPRQRKVRTSVLAPAPGDNSFTTPDKSQKVEATKLEVTKVTDSEDKKKKESTRKPSDYEVISREPADGLPPGWIKEVKMRKNSPLNKKDPFYLDPLSGYIFLSKLDALRYLETGDIKKCAMKPLRKDGYENYTGEESETPEVLPNGRKYEGEPDTSGNSDAGRRKRSNNRENRILEPPFDEVVTTSPADGLPPGWIKEIRTRHYSTHKRSDPFYTDPLSGYIFRSKLDALRYLQTGSIEKCANKPRKRDIDGIERAVSLTEDGSSPNLRPPRASRNDDVYEWLPEGWIAEVKTRDSGPRSGTKFKCYTETVSGRKFYSKPQVLTYLNRGNNSTAKKRKVRKRAKFYSEADDTSGDSDVGTHRRSRKKKQSIGELPYSEVVTTCPADGLPPGWIKELRIRQYSTHKRSDPYYTDPVSGYIFRSKLDALRYLETGGIETCAIKPTKKDVNGEETPVGAIGGQTPVDSTIRKQLFEDNNVEKQDNNIPTEIPNGTDPNTAEKNSVSTPPTRKVTKTTKRGKFTATSPGRSSKRLKGIDADTKTDPLLTEAVGNDENGRLEGAGEVKAKQVTGVNVENQNDGQTGETYEVGGGEASWTDIDFTVQTLTDEISFRVAPMQERAGPSSEAGVNVNVNENPTKVN